MPTIMLKNYLKLTSSMLTYTVILNFVLKMILIINLSTPSEIKGKFLNLFEKFGWDLDNFDGDSEGGSTGGNEQQN